MWRPVRAKNSSDHRPNVLLQIPSQPEAKNMTACMGKARVGEEAEEAHPNATASPRSTTTALSLQIHR